MNKPFMYLVGYDTNFMNTCNTGWGCGYIAIPETLDLYKNHVAKNAYDDNEAYENGYSHYEYFNLIGFDQEITLTTYKKINDINYLIIGFDTAHGWNGKEHNFNYVFNETAKMLTLVENY